MFMKGFVLQTGQYQLQFVYSIFRKVLLPGSPPMFSLPSAAVIQDNPIIDAGGNKRGLEESIYAHCS